MAKQLTIDDARQSLNAHAEMKGAEILEKYGPRIGWNELQQILADPSCVRYPCELRFDETPLLDEEVAYPVAKGERPEDGFTICVHPFFQCQPDRVPYLVLYQLVAVIYGDFASAEDAEVLASRALGLNREDYYRELCALADQLGGTSHSCGSGLLGCG